MTGSGFSGAVEFEQIACDFLHILFSSRFRARPLGRAQLAQRRHRIAHADVARHAVKLIGRDIELISTGVTQQEILALHAGRIELDQALEAPDAVFLVYHVIAGIDLGQKIGWGDQLAALCLLAARPAEDLGIGKDLDSQSMRLPAFAQLALDQRQGATFR